MVQTRKRRYSRSRSRSTRRGRTRSPRGRTTSGATAVPRGRSMVRSTSSRRSSNSSLRGTPTKVGDGHYQTAFSYGKKTVPKIIHTLVKDVGYTVQGYNTSLAYSTTPGLQTISAGELAAFTVADINTYCPKSALGQKVFLHQCTQRIMGINQSNENMFVLIYDVVSRHDASESDAIARSTPEALWGSAGTPTIVGADPFQTSIFTQNWKVKKVTRFVLTEGQTFEHIKHMRPNKLIGYNYLYQLSAAAPITPGYLKGITEYSVICMHGSPGDGDNTTVSTLGAKLDIIASWQYSSVNPTGNFTNPVFTNNLGVAATHVMSTDLGTDVIRADA